MPTQQSHDQSARYRSLAAILVCLLVAALLFMSNQIVLLPELPNWYDQQRFLMLLLLATALSVFALLPAPSPPYVTLLLIVALALSALSPLPGWALAESAIFTGLVATAYWVGIALREVNRYRPELTVNGLIIYGTLISLPPLMQFGISLGNGSSAFALYSLFSGFSNHRFFSQTESVLIPLMALPAMWLNTDSRWRKLGNVSICLLWVLAFAAGTRAFYVAMIAGGSFAWFFHGQTGRQWTRWQLKFAGMGWFGYLLLFKVMPWILGIVITSDNARLNQLESALNSSGRLEMWIAAVRLITEHPLTGIGPMHFATLAAETKFAAGFAAHPHNSVIQLMVEWGLPMGLTLLALVGLGFWRLFQATHIKTENASLALQRHIMSITLFTTFIYSLLDGSIVTPYTQILLAFVIGWAWSLLPTAHRTTARQTQALQAFSTILTRCCCVLAGCFLIWLAVYPYPKLTSHVELYAKSYPGQPLWPRLWSQGLINLPGDQRYHGSHFNYPAPSTNTSK